MIHEPMPVRQITTHLQYAHSDLPYLIKRAKPVVAPASFDTIIGTGLSGALFVPQMARELGKYWAIVRKGYDVYRSPYKGGAHTLNYVEGEVGASWLFVDDQVDSGLTFKRVKRAMKREMPHSAYAGTYTYIFYELYGPDEKVCWPREYK